jgi:hypothetical protein
MTTIDEQELSLVSVLGGGLIEMFDDAMRVVAANIQDVNTEATTTRQVKITVTMKPSSDRAFVSSTFAVSTSLAPQKPAAVRMVCTAANGREPPRFFEMPGQQQLPFDDDGTVVKLKGRGL